MSDDNKGSDTDSGENDGSDPSAGTRDLFFFLTPDLVLDAAEWAGLEPTGRFLQLNSLENRVFSVDLEGGGRAVMKFYRPGRWNAEQVLEEHGFLLELDGAGVPVCAPRALPGGSTVGAMRGILFAAWNVSPGRIPEDLSESHFAAIGRLIASIHAVGERRPAPSRPGIDADTLVRRSAAYLLGEGLVPAKFAERYRGAAEGTAVALDRALEGVPRHRVHGDFHRGNLLFDGKTFRVLDFDDFGNGPAAQDVWMLTSPADPDGIAQREAIVGGYRSLRPFPSPWLDAVEPLRAARFVNYAAWIARRRADPSFPSAFPDFGSQEYWETETADLESLVRDGFPPAIAPERPPLPEGEDPSTLTNKDYFYDWED
ncbi:MAG: serine/threonine protein kinase [Spirochaetes bacterium]|nr:serine/threonine protein kinase [Spirochaetota bacterium]